MSIKTFYSDTSQVTIKNKEMYDQAIRQLLNSASKAEPKVIHEVKEKKL